MLGRALHKAPSALFNTPSPPSESEHDVVVDAACSSRSLLRNPCRDLTKASLANAILNSVHFESGHSADVINPGTSRYAVMDPSRKGRGLQKRRQGLPPSGKEEKKARKFRKTRLMKKRRHEKNVVVIEGEKVLETRNWEREIWNMQEWHEAEGLRAICDGFARLEDDSDQEFFAPALKDESSSTGVEKNLGMF